jgi:hypothetical protein
MKSTDPRSKKYPAKITTPVMDLMQYANYPQISITVRVNVEE